MDEIAKKNLIESYQENGGFIVHSAESLKKIYQVFGIDPRASTDRRILDVEGVTHFFQHGVQALFRRMNITGDDRVLSLGEGNGAPSRLLVKLTGCFVTGVDINPDQVAKAVECAALHGVEERVEYVISNVEELDLERKDYTKAYCNETTCHWQVKPKAFANIVGHLRPGATVGINEWTRGDRGALADAGKEIPEFIPLYKDRIWFQESLPTYTKLLEECGLRILYAKDCTSKVDARMRARLKEVLSPSNPYVKAMGEEARLNGKNYYEAMIRTHFDFLRYAVIIAQK